MMLKLSKTKLTLYSVLITLTFPFLKCSYKIFTSNFTHGTVIEVKIGVNNTGLKSYTPVIEFQDSEGKYHIFPGGLDLMLNTNEKVEVIYNKYAPDDEAYVYSFGGFWLTPFIYSIIPLLIIAAWSIAFLEDKAIYIINFGKRKPGEKLFDKEYKINNFKGFEY